MNTSLSSWLLAGLVANLSVSAATHWVDASLGRDANPGTETAPWKSLDSSMGRLTGGDTLLLRSGSYGDLGYGRSDRGAGRAGNPLKSYWWEPIAEIFSDWVTVRGEVGAEAHLGAVSLGTWLDTSGVSIPFATRGNSNLRMRLENLRIDDGVKIQGSRYVEIRKCVVRLRGDTIAIMPRAGIAVFNGQFVTLEGNEITHCGIGIQGMTRDFVVRDNEIHHNSHDGMSILGGENWLVEGNRIHDLDDGADDAEQTSGAKPWNMHVDGIQMYMVGNGDAKYAIGSKNFTFRNNIFYHLEAMGVMINANNAGGEYRDFTWENNIWGPVGGTGFHLGADFAGRFVFRNNTQIYAPKDVWTSIFGRIMDGQRYNLALWNKPVGAGSVYEFYNNIFATSFGIPTTYDFVGRNIFLGTKDTPLDRGQTQVKSTPYAAVFGTIPDFLAGGGVLGELNSTSPAVDSGSTRLSLLDDAYGGRRDAKIDIGAVEYRQGTAVNSRSGGVKTWTGGLASRSHDLLGRFGRAPWGLENELCNCSI